MDVDAQADKKISDETNVDVNVRNQAVNFPQNSFNFLTCCNFFLKEMLNKLIEYTHISFTEKYVKIE